MRHRLMRWMGYLVVSGCAPAAALAQATSIAGRVTDAGTGQPIADARVLLLGTSLSGVTSADGRYTLRSVPTGAAVVRVLRVGYQDQKNPLTVSAGQAATLDFALVPSVVKLQEVVTTATGDQRRIELGNAVSTIDAAQLTQTAPIAQLSDLLTARAAGVSVLPNNMTGAAARIRIRGTSSLSLSNDPIYVIDGVRMTSNSASSTVDIGGTTLSRVQDIDPADIDNIEVVKGPSAATLYGTDAANGVIVITTKRGRAGPAKWDVFAEGGAIKDLNSYPNAYTLFGHTSAGRVTTCSIISVGSGACTADSLKSYNLFKDPNATPLGTGTREQVGLSLSGGTDNVRYFTAFDTQREVGVYRIPTFDVNRMHTQGIPIPDEAMHPNALQKNNLRANLNLAPTSALDISVSTGFINSQQRRPQTDNNTTGLLSNALGGPGFTTNGNGSLGNALNGWRRFTPGEIFQENVTQSIDRFLGSTNLNWRPTSWMANRANVGIDLTDRIDSDLCRRDNCSDFGTNRQGFAHNDRTNIRNFTADLGSTLSWHPKESITAKTTLGAQYIDYQLDLNQASSTILAGGATTVSGGTVFTAAEAHSLSKTLGAFVEEALAFNDRLFLSAAVRSDQNSAFGSNFQKVFYPKVQASWVVSDESFVPKYSWLNQLRLRAAYGASGVQPGSNDALRLYSTTRFNLAGSDVLGVIPANIGNSNLKPERSNEIETGLDAHVLNNRVNVELTYYSKQTRDALIARILPPSSGAGISPSTLASTRFENIGATKNAGFEGLISAQLVDATRFAWDVTLNGSTYANKLVKLGGVPPIIGTLVREAEGFPLNGYWAQRITRINDANHDHIIQLSEITVDTAYSFIGYSTPRHDVSLNNGFDLFQHKLRLSALFNYLGGFYIDNDTQRIRCQNRNNCRELADVTAPLDKQARVVALRQDPTRTQAGFIEKGDFVRWRELSATFTPTAGIARRFLRTDRASVTFAARNLHKWTKYSGIDPEANYDTVGDVQQDFQTAPPPTYFTLRLNLGF